MMNNKLIGIAGALFAGFTPCALAQYPGWQHQGAFFILTTPEGADLPSAASEKNFPLLLRLNKDTFDFSQAKADGADLRVSAGGQPLSYQIEKWDAAIGTASVWVRIPEIKGNAQQEIKLHWGKADAASESKGAAVFNADNGFVTVMHMDEALKDEVGTISPLNVGSTAATGVIGNGRNFVAGKGIDGGSHIKNFPFSNNPFSFACWFRADAAGPTVIYFGNYPNRYNVGSGSGDEVSLTMGSPPSIFWASDGPGGAAATTEPVLGRWYHAAATYANGTSRIYVNGKQEASRPGEPNTMSILNDVTMTIGGMRGSYQFAGDIDEVRLSSVERSADWMRMEYENQRAGQSLVGCLVQAGNTFAVAPGVIQLDEGKILTVTAQAGGARKLYWIVKRDGAETVVAVDQFSYALDSGRVVGDTDYVLQVKAVYPNEVKTRDIAVKIKEQIPEPVVVLNAPAAWNGRDTIEVIPAISNLAAMKAKGAGSLTYKWSVAGGAVIKEVAPDRLILKRSQCSNKITVRLALGNGGADTIATTSIQVSEPKQDAWVQRVPAKDEQPEDNQFYADEDPVTPINNWIRSYGNQLEGTIKGGWGNAVRMHIWGRPNCGDHSIGSWGMVLATNLVQKYSIPVCFINGAYGGTPIWHHQPNPANHSDASGAFYQNRYKIYGCMLTRVKAAKLTHGIRGVFWHQGENDSGAGAPTGDWNYKSYQQDFIDMTAAWKQDYPNIKNFYVYQIWPLPCGMGPKDDQIREAQRTLPALFSNLRVMSTIGAASEHAGRGSCHFDLATYAKFGRYMSPLVEQDIYGFKPQQPITAPDIKRAWFTSAAKNEIALDFGQPVVWNDDCKASIYLDGVIAPINTGKAEGNLVTLQLSKPGSAKTITYLTGKDWDGKPEKRLMGANGIGALTFADVAIATQGK